MLRLSLTFVVVGLYLISGTATGTAAEISCDLTYGQSNPFAPKGEPPDIDFGLPPGFVIDQAPLSFDLDLVPRHWPSGARPKWDTCQIALMQGKIEKNDYDKFLAFYRKHHPFLHHVRLISSGGDVNAAMMIGRLFRKYLVAVSAPDSNSYLPINNNKDGIPSQDACALLGDQRNCVCASACAFIWFGAPDRSGRVGLHRPRFTDPRFSKLPPSEATVIYRQALQTIGRFLEEMEAPKTMIDALVSTGSGEMTWIEDGFGSLTDGLRMDRAPSFAEWVAASCRTWSHEEHREMTQLMTKEVLKGVEQQSRGMTTRERQRFETLLARMNRQRACEAELISSNRDRMPPP